MKRWIEAIVMIAVIVVGIVAIVYVLMLDTGRKESVWLTGIVVTYACVLFALGLGNQLKLFKSNGKREERPPEDDSEL